MPKIDTAYLKQHVKCGECHGDSLKRRHKQSFKSKVDKDGNVVPEFTLNWRVFECDNCGENTNVLDDGNEILDQRAFYALHPFSAFEFCVYLYTGHDQPMICLDMYYLSKINEEFVCADDVRDDHILGFTNFFRNLGFKVDNLMENQWELYEGDYLLYERTKEAVDKIREALVAAGAKYDKKSSYMGLYEPEAVAY